MNSFQTAAKFDLLAFTIVAGSLGLLCLFLWVIFDRREYEDPMRRRRRKRASALPGGPPKETSGEAEAESPARRSA